jgi:hypothetical protein
LWHGDLNSGPQHLPGRHCTSWAILPALEISFLDLKTAWNLRIICVNNNSLVSFLLSLQTFFFLKLCMTIFTQGCCLLSENKNLKTAIIFKLCILNINTTVNSPHCFLH